jgi:hypothetical protein
MEIKRIVDRATGVPILTYRGALDNLAQRLLGGSVVVFLGAGCNIDPGGSLPSAATLSREMAERCGLQWHEYIPLSTIAFYYESFRSRGDLNRYLVEKLGNESVAPSATIRLLVEIIQLMEELGTDCFVITTNYDRQFERAYRARTGRDVEVVVYNGGTDANHLSAMLHPALGRKAGLWRPRTRTALYKMHGCISRPASPELFPPELHNLVVTEEDYINFLSNALSQNPEKSLLREAEARIADSTTLFLGYSLTDWNFRVIYKATAERYSSESFAVQLFRPRDGQEEMDEARHAAAVDFWGHKKVDIVNVDAARFMEDLLATVNREIEAQPPVERRRPPAAGAA